MIGIESCRPNSLFSRYFGMNTIFVLSRYLVSVLKYSNLSSLSSLWPNTDAPTPTNPYPHITAYFKGITIGAICSRIEVDAEVDADKSGEKLYIMTLVTLASYRRRGVGRALLESVLKYAKEDLKVQSVYLHVQTSNDAARKFYESFGFKIQETIKGYYKRIDPPDCYVLTCPIVRD